MDEARRFLRYLTPGALFVAEAWLLARLLFPNWQALATLQQNSGLGLALAAVLFTGAVGFVLGAVHHATLNSGYGTRLDYSGVVRHVVKSRTLAVADSASGEPWSSTQPLGRLEAFAIVTSVWHQLTELSPRLKSANTRAQQLADMAHSMGAAFVGSLGAPAAVFGAALVGRHAPVNPCERIPISLIGVVLICVVVWKNRQRTFELCEQFVTICLADALRELGPQERPFRTSFPFHPPLQRTGGASAAQAP
jgi:hypothetical protein